MGLGRVDEAIAWALEARELSTDPLYGLTLVLAYMEFGNTDRAKEMMLSVPNDHVLYPFSRGLQKCLINDFEGCLEKLEEAIDGQDNPQQFVLDSISNAAMLIGDIAKAREYSERRNPEFAGDADITIDSLNVGNVIRYAYILQLHSEHERADKLLEAAYPVVQELPRLGMVGHGIKDVQILSLQGNVHEALAALGKAVDSGFRGEMIFEGWPLNLDPYLTSMRGQPDFQAMEAEIDDALMLMRERVEQAEASDNWDNLRALAASN